MTKLSYENICDGEILNTLKEKHNEVIQVYTPINCSDESIIWIRYTNDDVDKLILKKKSGAVILDYDFKSVTCNSLNKYLIDELRTKLLSIKNLPEEC
jgi:myo-inositol-hexaphosphate 3-phosphohydrolase